MTATVEAPGAPAQAPGVGRWWLAGFIVSSAAGIILSFAAATSQPILGARWALLDLFAAWAGVWVIAVLCALRLPLRRRWAVLAIAVVAVVVRVAALSSTPTLSDDLYRYSWDARVQLSGVDPYRRPPQSGALVALREAWLWPDAGGCQRIDRPAGCTRINRPDVRTIYPPVAEGWFSAVYRLGGGIGARHKLWQVAGLVTELVTMALIVVALLRRGRDPRWLALYALCPAPVIEVVNDGHVDGLAILFLIAAFLALCPRPGPARDATPGPISVGRAALAGALIGGATLVKLYPIVALLALWMAPGIRIRHRLASAGAAIGVVVVGYAPHVLAVGVKVLGYLPGYLKEEHYTGTSSRYLLAAALHLHGHVADAAVGGAVVATVVVLAVRRLPALEAMTVLLGVLLLAATPVQPWYAVTLVALAAVAARPRWGVVVVAGYPYFFAVILSAVHQNGIGQISYGAAVVALVPLSGGVIRGAGHRGRRVAPT